MTTLYKTVFYSLINKPAKAFRLIASRDLRQYQTHLLVLIGISNVIGRQLLKLADIEQNVWGRGLALVILGALVGWMGVYIWSALISVVGKWLGGNASTPQVLNVITYTAFPGFIMLIVSVIAIIILRSLQFDLANYSIFMHTWRNNYYCIIQTTKYCSYAMEWYQIFLTVIAISAIQGFSYAKSIANFVIAALVIIVPIILIVLAIRFKH